MEIGRVVGPAPSTVKHAALAGLKLVTVRPEGSRWGGVVVAWDLVDAGPGDRVLIMREGGAAVRLLGRGKAPIRTVVVAHVERVDGLE
ncbi:MAG: EutN/CcmL family microcompartment protein [Candidatus Coatesbacteria bacterium]|nr:MAG: EutN/CcmL family microcompartment protein [Candidatus Coatesbacteria bacterium]